MVKVKFVTVAGTEREVEANVGENLMQIGLNNDISQILADCGGAMSCATCHVHIAPEWIDAVGRASEEEQAMLEMAIDPDECSRLSCQVVVSPELDGLVVNLPASQI